MNKRKISFVKWLDLRGKILHLNQPLVEIIDQINPQDLPDLIEVDYLYGDTIVKNGTLQIPQDNTLISIQNNNIPLDFREALSYQELPLFMNIQNNNEVFIDTGSRIIPLNLFYPGSLIGLFETVDYILNNSCKSMWNILAGARTIIMLPKISNEIGLKRLRKYYDLPFPLKLKELSDQFEVFRLIASSTSFSQVWINKILFFTKKWFSHDFLTKYPAFKSQILSQCWSQARFALEKVKLDLIWEKFSEATALRKLNPGPFLTNHAKHLMNIVSGNSPSLCPTLMSQNTAPVEGLQNAIMDIYGLKKNIPIVMTLKDNNQDKLLQSYYSLSFPTILEGSPLNKSHSTISETLRDLKILMDNFQQYIKVNKIEEALLNHIRFQYIYTGQNSDKELLHSSEIIDQPDFSQYKNIFPTRIFPYSSYFWNGCIRIILNN